MEESASNAVTTRRGGIAITVKRATIEIPQSPSPIAKLAKNVNVIQLEHQAGLAIKPLGNALAKMASPESHATVVPKDTNKVGHP